MGLRGGSERMTQSKVVEDSHQVKLKWSTQQ